MSTVITKQLHWTQRIALVRHNLHAASRSGDFSFFKTLQAAGLLEGTNHYAILSATMGDEADALLAGLDNLNAGLGYIHQDAFKNVYDGLKSSMREGGDDKSSSSKLYVDITMQKNMANMSIDKMANSAIALISQQPDHVREEAASVWVTGVTLMADCMEITIKQLDVIEYNMDDFIRLEDSWNCVNSSVVAAITGLKGVFSLMDPSSPQDEKQTRSMSISSAGSAVFRRLSTALQSPSHSRSSSIASSTSLNRSPTSAHFGEPVYRTPNYLHNSISNGCPTRMPSKLSAISPTPVAHLEDMDPFDVSVPLLPVPVLDPSRLAQAVM